MANNTKNSSPISSCLTSNNIIAGGGSIIENNDGTISVFLAPSKPYFLTKQCCEFLSNKYYFDIDNQQCRWSKPIDCSENNNINVILNPKGNDGAIFTLNDGDNCYFDISFDYLIQFKCEDLVKVGMSVLSGNTTSSASSSERLTNQTNNFETNNDTDCDYLISQLESLNNELNMTPYSIEYNNTYYCFTEDGLNTWSTILNNINYSNFLNGDLTSYSNDDILTLISYNGNNNLLYECNVNPDAISILKTQITDLEIQITECQNNSLLRTNSTTSGSGNSETPVEVPFIDCSNAINALESFILTFSLDLYDDITNKTTPVFENTLIGIGEDNLFTYLTTSGDTGLLICGDTGCTNSFVLNDINLTGYCKMLSNQLISGLITEAANNSVTLTSSNLLTYISNSSFNSNWKHYNTIINDNFILPYIANKKIKISFKLKNTCTNVCLLVDNIKLNRVCSDVENNKLIISESPKFELNKIIDNKKSWVTNNETHNREFDLTLRETDYNINHYKLAINTKEIDLNISTATAIENDVWCYINDNSCILTGICNTCFSCPIGYMLDEGGTICWDGIDIGNQVPVITGTCETTCGDGCISLNNLITTPLSSITTIQDFQRVIFTELIDVKSRKTLSSYPTLRLLYDRYLNSSLYCNTVSSNFTYLSMDKFANLVGTYWVDLVEQVIPATTIWESTYVYRNTIFDTQKFKYRKNNTLFCLNVDSETSEPIPTDIIGSATTVQVLQMTLTNNDSENIVNSEIQVCNGVYTNKIDCGSEFIGKIIIIGNLSAEVGGSEIVIT